MLHNLAAGIEPEDVDARPIPVPRPVLKAVEHDVVALGDHPLEFHPLARV
jgi:hypothetical protein